MGGQRVRKDLEGSVHVVDPDSGERVVLTKGDEVPEWATVGDHLLERGRRRAAPGKPPADGGT